MSIETIDADLCEPAVLAVVFNTHARLEIKSVGKRAGTDAAMATTTAATYILLYIVCCEIISKYVYTIGT